MGVGSLVETVCFLAAVVILSNPIVAGEGACVKQDGICQEVLDPLATIRLGKLAQLQAHRVCQACL